MKVVTGVVVPVVGVALAWAIGNRGDRLALIVIGFGGMVFVSLMEVAPGP